MSVPNKKKNCQEQPKKQKFEDAAGLPTNLFKSHGPCIYGVYIVHRVNLLDPACMVPYRSKNKPCLFLIGSQPLYFLHLSTGDGENKRRKAEEEQEEDAGEKETEEDVEEKTAASEDVQRKDVETADDSESSEEESSEDEAEEDQDDLELRTE